MFEAIAYTIHGLNTALNQKGNMFNNRAVVSYAGHSFSPYNFLVMHEVERRPESEFSHKIF